MNNLFTRVPRITELCACDEADALQEALGTLAYYKVRVPVEARKTLDSLMQWLGEKEASNPCQCLVWRTHRHGWGKLSIVRRIDLNAELPRIEAGTAAPRGYCLAVTDHGNVSLLCNGRTLASMV